MMATVAAHLNYVAALIGLVGWGLYFRTLLSGHVRTIPMNWLATAIIAFTASVTTAELSSIPHAALYLVNTVCALTVVAKSLPNLEKVRRADGLLIGLGLLMFACAFRWPQYAALLVSAYYVVNYVSMGLRVLRGHGVEHPAGWFAWACGASVLAFSLRHHGGYSELVPVTNIVVWSWMGSIATYRRWLGTRASAPDTMHGATLNVVVEPDDAAPGEVACELEAPAAAHQMTGATLAPVCQAEKHGPRSAGRDGAGPALALGQYPSVVAFRLDDARRMRLDHVHDTHFAVSQARDRRACGCAVGRDLDLTVRRYAVVRQQAQHHHGSVPMGAVATIGRALKARCIEVAVGDGVAHAGADISGRCGRSGLEQAQGILRAVHHANRVLL